MEDHIPLTGANQFGTEIDETGGFEFPAWLTGFLLFLVRKVRALGSRA